MAKTKTIVRARSKRKRKQRISPLGFCAICGCWLGVEDRKRGGTGNFLFVLGNAMQLPVCGKCVPRQLIYEANQRDSPYIDFIETSTEF